MSEKVVPRDVAIASKGALMAQASRSVMSRADKILVFSGHVGQQMPNFQLKKNWPHVK